MKKKKKLFLIISMIFTILSTVLVGCSSEQGKDTSSNKTSTENKTTTAATGGSAEIPTAIKDKKLKFAFITEFSTGTHASQHINGAKNLAKEWGIELDVKDANNDQSKMASYLESAINEKVDGILISHGRTETLKPGVEKAVANKIPVVAFDVEIPVDGVTTVDQDDYLLALQGLKKLSEDIDGKGNIAYIWVGGFAPMEKRNRVYDIMLQRYPEIKEVAKFGNASSNTSLDTQTKMEAVLKQFPNKGDIKAVWAPWDEFAKGATRAIKESGRTDIKVYGMDLSDEDLQIIQEENSPWVASAAVDPTTIGQVQIRLLLKKIAGEQTPKFYSLTPTLVTKEMLPKDKKVNMDDLKDIIPGWGKNNDFVSPWMNSLSKK